MIRRGRPTRAGGDVRWCRPAKMPQPTVPTPRAQPDDRVDAGVADSGVPRAARSYTLDARPAINPFRSSDSENDIRSLEQGSHFFDLKWLPM